MHYILKNQFDIKIWICLKSLPRNYINNIIIDYFFNGCSMEPITQLEGYLKYSNQLTFLKIELITRIVRSFREIILKFHILKFNAIFHQGCWESGSKPHPDDSEISRIFFFHLSNFSSSLFESSCNSSLPSSKWLILYRVSNQLVSNDL